MKIILDGTAHEMAEFFGKQHKSRHHGSWQKVGRRGVKLYGKWIASEIVTEHFGELVFIKPDGIILNQAQKKIHPVED